MAWADWVDLEFLQSLFKHAVSVAATFLVFALVAWVAKQALGADSTAGRIIDGVEQIVLLGLVIWLIIVLATDIWRKGPWGNGGTHNLVLA